ncbi:MAG: NAD(P)H-hydrate dehydratase [Pirellulaceae bacterium]
MEINRNNVACPTRPHDVHKGSCGHVVVIAGSESMPGAAALVGLAALRTGAGLVTILTAKESPIVASFSPCLMVVPLPAKGGLISIDAMSTVKSSVAKADVVAIGPGLGQSEDLQRLVSWVYQDVKIPVVLDADGLNNLAGSAALDHSHEGERVLTPHLGEFRRLTNEPAMELSLAKERLVEFSTTHELTCLLKGPRTRVAHRGVVRENSTGNSGMATAGSGDVLTGIIAGLIAQGLSAFDAACTGVFLHGLAGDIVAEKKGVHSLIATDLIEHLPDAILMLEKA